MHTWDSNQSHEHSLLTLELLNGFDDFKASIKHMADFGCGSGLDLEYWGNMRENTAEGPGEYLNFNCVGFDLNAGLGLGVVHTAAQIFPVGLQNRRFRQVVGPGVARYFFGLADDVELTVGLDFADQNRLGEVVVR